MKHTRRKFIKLGGLTTLAGMSGVGIGLASCQGSDEGGFEEDNAFSISGVSIPSTIDVTEGGEVIISGKGFKIGDAIQLTSVADPSFVKDSAVFAVTAQTVSFIMPKGSATGSYKLTLNRGVSSLLLGTTFFNFVANTNIPDIDGMTIKGVVYANGAGVPGVVVSDGFEVTKTDANGIYYLPSLKKSGFVFISIPGGYEVTTQGKAPQFFKRLSNNASVIEQKDFSLLEVNNTKHVVISMADWHLARRNNDIDQFTNKVLPDVNATIDQYAAEGTKVYVLTLGDMTWDLYWYKNNFGLNEYLPYMNKLNAPVFNLIGNHDYDPYYANDWEAENKFREVLGPTYYSFNLGDIHYIVLDDVEYLNTGGSIGTVGSRNYNYMINAAQIAWLKKDLAAISDKHTPIVLAMHTPLYKQPSLGANGTQINALSLYNGAELIACFNDFTSVNVLTGHTHLNNRIAEEANLMEHNTGAICATWWWTGKDGYAGNHICKDGSPGGFGVWKMDGTSMEWSYKSIGYSEDYQFRSYDLNTVHITAAEFAPNVSDADIAEYVGPYGQQQMGNEVLINLWGYEPQWSIVVTENGVPLHVTQVRAKDPLHIISYDLLRANAGAIPTGAFVTNESIHFFKVKASSPDATLEIKVTNQFGRVYSETMIRPKPFSVSMS